MFIFVYKLSLGTVLIWCQFVGKLGKFGDYNLNCNTKILCCICSFGIEAQITAEDCILVPYCSFEPISWVCFREQQFIFADKVVRDLLIDWRSCLFLREYKTTCRCLKLPLESNYADQKKENEHTGIYQQKNIFYWKSPTLFS